MAEKGLRVLAVWTKQENVVQVIGLLAFSDSLREDSAKLIHKIQDLGISVKMITGDTKETARYIAKQAGIEDKVCQRDRISEDCSMFAGVYPTDKFKIVKFLQSKNHIVGMTGDGINDAAALKQANFGIAVSNATDVAKAASAVVLTQEGILNILKSIEISRKIYQRMLTYIFNKTIRVFCITLSIFVFYILYGEFLLSTSMIIALFFYNDFLTLSLTTDNVFYSKKPDKWDMKKIAVTSFLLSVFMLIYIFALLAVGKYYLKLDIQEIKTFAFVILVLSIPVSILSVRERGSMMKIIPSKALILSMVVAVIGSSLMAFYGILMPHLTLTSVLIANGAMLFVFIPFALYKILIFKLFKVV